MIIFTVALLKALVFPASNFIFFAAMFLLCLPTIPWTDLCVRIIFVIFQDGFHRMKWAILLILRRNCVLPCLLLLLLRTAVCPMIVSHVFGF